MDTVSQDFERDLNTFDVFIMYKSFHFNISEYSKIIHVFK